MNLLEEQIYSLKHQTLSLQTARLQLRQIMEIDAPEIVQLRSSPEDYQFFAFPHQLTLAEHLQWYREKYLVTPNRFDWIAMIQSKPIGLFGVQRTYAQPEQAEVSYLLTKEERGKGYAREAVDILLQWAYYEWNCRMAVAKIHKDNIVSQHFITKSGFHLLKEEPPFLFYKKNLYITEDNKKISYQKKAQIMEAIVNPSTCNTGG